MGRRFELRTDHCGLKYLFDQPTPNARKARWLEFLCEFDFGIKHIKGKENKVVTCTQQEGARNACGISQYFPIRFEVADC